MPAYSKWLQSLASDPGTAVALTATMSKTPTTNATEQVASLTEAELATITGGSVDDRWPATNPPPNRPWEDAPFPPFLPV